MLQAQHMRRTSSLKAGAGTAVMQLPMVLIQSVISKGRNSHSHARFVKFIAICLCEVHSHLPMWRGTM